MSKRRMHRRSREDAGTATRVLLANVVLPAWAAFGIIDWGFHRATRIERNAGALESLTHLLMGAEGAVCALTGILFEMDAGVLAAMLGAALAHEATAVWDVRYAKHRRPLVQAEQHVHSFLEALPFAAVGVAAALHGPRARAKPVFRRANVPLPARSVALAAASGFFGMLVHVEEFVRCLRVKPALAPQPERPPDQPAARAT
ncbi:MAG: hypothetical protein ABR591_06140 [Candidatus Velthaea sp.]